MVGYGIRIKIKGTLDELKPRVIQALKERGFGVLTEIDVQRTIKQRLGVAYKPYLILGTCNPGFTHCALSSDEGIGVLLPCNVVLKQDEDGVFISIQDPEVMFSVLDDELKKSMFGFPQEVKQHLNFILQALKN
jgi:uncharacterized protein (DUF302 family)